MNLASILPGSEPSDLAFSHGLQQCKKNMDTVAEILVIKWNINFNELNSPNNSSFKPARLDKVIQ